MKVEFKTIIEFTEKEVQAIEQARDILCEYESNSRPEQDDTLMDKFEDIMGYRDMDYSALSVTIDFLTFLLRMSGYEKEEY